MSTCRGLSTTTRWFVRLSPEHPDFITRYELPVLHLPLESSLLWTVTRMDCRAGQMLSYSQSLRLVSMG